MQKVQEMQKALKLMAQAIHLTRIELTKVSLLRVKQKEGQTDGRQKGSQIPDVPDPDQGTAVCMQGGNHPGSYCPGKVRVILSAPVREYGLHADDPWYPGARFFKYHHRRLYAADVHFRAVDQPIYHSLHHHAAHGSGVPIPGGITEGWEDRPGEV